MKLTLQKHALKISAHVDGGRAGVSRVRRHRSEDPHRHEWNLHFQNFSHFNKALQKKVFGYEQELFMLFPKYHYFSLIGIKMNELGPACQNLRFFLLKKILFDMQGTVNA